MTVVVDASVAYKWFSTQPDTDQALALLDGDDTLHAPDLILPEVCNAAWKAVRVKAMTERQADAIPSRLTLVLGAIRPSAELARGAMAIARAVDHPVYDCFYIALAEHLDTVLVTADSKLVRRFRTSKWGHRLVALSGYSALGTDPMAR